MGEVKQNLAQQVAERILSMITVDGALSPGDKLPNEIEFSASLGVSRTTLREAIRILSSHDVLEIRRGRGTFVVERPEHERPIDLSDLAQARPDLRALYEMRLMVEPQSACYAAQRASGEEIERILHYGRLEEEQIRAGEDRTRTERAFHKAINKAAHNAFVERLMPVIYEAIDSGVQLSRERDAVVEDTLSDHRMIMEFIKNRDPLGAKAAMRLHIIHAMRGFGISEE